MVRIWCPSDYCQLAGFNGAGGFAPDQDGVAQPVPAGRVVDPDIAGEDLPGTGQARARVRSELVTVGDSKELVVEPGGVGKRGAAHKPRPVGPTLTRE